MLPVKSQKTVARRFKIREREGAVDKVMKSFTTYKILVMCNL